MYLYPIKYPQHPIKNMLVASTTHSPEADLNGSIFRGLDQGKARPLR